MKNETTKMTVINAYQNALERMQAAQMLVDEARHKIKQALELNQYCNDAEQRMLLLKAEELKNLDLAGINDLIKNFWN